MKPSEVRAALEANVSLNATLDMLRIQRAEETYGYCDYVDASGVVLFSGRAGQCWDWLRGLAGAEETP